ncbi:MAG: efflux transporter outer membrane subunit [Variibacter sp.]|nr:efflux transporter outer membrane subunit [Variibacter sp.]
MQGWHDRTRAARAAARARRPAAALAAALLLSGCFLGPEKLDVPLEVPDAYSHGPARAGAAVPGPDWFRGFRSRELDALIAEARKENLDIRVAIAQILQADAQVQIAGAALLPEISGLANVQRARSSGAVSGSGAAAERTVFNTGLSASYILDFWGRNRALLNAAEETAVVNEYNRDVVALTAIVSVANTYFQVLAAQDRLQVARSNVASSMRILRLIRERFAAGTASQLDVSQQEALYAQQRASIPPLEQSVQQNTAALALLVGRAAPRFRVRGGSMLALATPRITAGLPSDLINQRPDIRLAEARLAAASFSVEAARAAFFPTIQLTGSTGFQSSALQNLFTPGAWYYTLAAGLTQPIFDGGLLKGQLKQARGVQLQALEQYRQAVLSGFTDVERALIAIEQTARQLRLQAEVVRSSQQAFDVAEAQLRGGTANLITVLQTQQTLFSAQDTLLQVRLARLLAAVSLFQALGGGWTPEEARPSPYRKDIR